MATKCGSFVRGRRMRVTRLDGCGRPIYGPDSVVTSSGMVTVAYTANIDEGEEVNQTNANGDRCIYEPARPSFLGYTLEITFCQVDPELFAIMTGQDVMTDAFGDVVGFCMDTAIGLEDTAFALEVWAGAPSAGSCDQAGAQGNFGYFLTPFVQGGILGDFTIENGAVTFTISNAATKDGNSWGVGPYDVVVGADGTPSPLAEPISSTKALCFLQVGINPPDAECGARPLLNPADEPLTDVTATPTDNSASFSPEPASTDAWWVDFGDGTWDYSADGSDIEHDYAVGGTYEWVARRNDSMITGDVTVTDPPAPTIASVDPVSGPEAGGDVVTVTGTNFTGATAVTFGGVAGTGFTVVSPTEITVTTPAGTVGDVDVVVVHPVGNATLTDGYAYV